MADLTVSNDIDNFMQSANNAAARAALELAKVEEPVIDETERLALGTPAGTYVEQTDTPNVIFFQTGADASDPDNWFALPKNVKSNFSASTAPTVNDDSTDDYQVGSLWIDTTNNEAYRCVDASSGAAVWIESTYDGAEVSAAITAAIVDKQDKPSEGAFVNGDKTKLDNIEANADVTDTANVTAAGALMESEVTNPAAVKLFDPADYATDTQGSNSDSHISATNNPHGVTKTQVGLGNVDNKSSATIRSEIVDENIPDTISRRDDDITSDKIIINENVRAFTLNDVGTVDRELTATTYTSTNGGPNANWGSNISSYIDFTLRNGRWEIYEDDNGVTGWRSADAVTPEYPWLVKTWTRVSAIGGSDELIFTLTNIGNSIVDEVSALKSGKANVSHTHGISDVTNLQSSLDNKVSNSFGVSDVRKVTQGEYDSLTPDDDTLYVVVDGVSVFVNLNEGRSNRAATINLSGSGYPAISIFRDDPTKFVGNVFGSSLSGTSVSVNFDLGEDQEYVSAAVSGGDNLVKTGGDNIGTITFDLTSATEVTLTITQDDDS